MKKIFSLLIALILVFSLCSVTVAFADGQTEHTVTVNNEKLAEIVNALPRSIEKSDEYKLPLTLDQLKTVFEGYAEGDTIKVRYWAPGANDWSTEYELDKGMNIVSDGEYSFQYVIRYKATENAEETVKYSSQFTFVTKDTTAPKDIELGASFDTEAERQIKVGSTKAVGTTTSYVKRDDASSVSVTYVVYKGTADLTDLAAIKALTLVYDSKTGKNYAEDEDGEKTEDYSSFISTSGTITGLQEDLGARYYVVYTLTDAWGNVADPFVAKLTVIESDVVVEQEQKIETWKIICFCVAGLCLVGIALLIFVKPKQAEQNTGRVHYTEETSDETNDQQ